MPMPADSAQFQTDVDSSRAVSRKRSFDMGTPWSGGQQDVGEAEGPGAAGGQGRRPGGIDGEERLGVGGDDADEHLADDAAADGSEPVAVVQGVGLLEDVEPERGL